MAEGGVQNPGEKNLNELSPRVPKDQNFYDQPPFDSILRSVQQETDQPIDVIRELLTRSTKEFGVLTKGDFPEYQESQAFLETINQKGSLRDILGKMQKSPSPNKFLNARKIIKSFSARLETFPWWTKYISSQMLSRYERYTPNGNYANRRASIAHEPSVRYSSWLLTERAEPKILPPLTQSGSPEARLIQAILNPKPTPKK